MPKEVTRLYETFQPTHYSLRLDPDRETMKLTGTIVIEGQKTGRPSQRLTFHQHKLKVTDASIVKHDKKGDFNIPVARINQQKSLDEVRIHTNEMLYGGRYSVTMTFEAEITDAMHGIYPCYYEIKGKRQALMATQFESHHAREAFPCIDEPEAKATFDLTLISPAGEVAISNTPIATQTEENGKLITTFETSPKMSTYLLAFVYGDMQHKEAATKDGVGIRVWSTRAHSLESLDFGLDVAKRSVEFFNDFFDTPYPLPKSDHVALPDFSSGAMENWGLITYRETCLLADPETSSLLGRELVATVVCHEVSHQWFGNLVTMKWWDDLWLNESFANVMEYRATDALFPEWNIWNAFITMEGLSAIRRDSIAGVQSIKTPVHHPDEISTLFDPSIVYAKGGRLLNMLMNYLGEDDFRKGLKEYFASHAYGNTTGDDLWDALGRASGKDVAAFMNPWLEQSGFPVITVNQDGNQLEVSQSHFLLDPQKTDKDRTWPVPMLSSNPEVPELLSGKTAKKTLSSDDYIHLNQGAIGHYVVHYTKPEHFSAIAKLVDTKQLDIPERLMLLSDSAMLARAGYQSFYRTLELLEHYAQEDSEPVWDIMSLIVADARRFIDAAPNLEQAIKEYIRKLIPTQYKRLGWEQIAGESAEDTKLRVTIIALGTYAKEPEILGRSLELFESYKKDPASVPSELRSIVFGAAIRNNVEGTFEYLIDLDESTSNVDLKHDVLGALTLVESPKQAEQLLSRLKDKEKVRPQEVGRWLALLLRNRHTQKLAWKWLRKEWRWIEETFAGDKSYDNYPRYAAGAFNTKELMDEYMSFFSPLKEHPALARNITMGVEELTNRITWVERDLEDLLRYFKVDRESRS